MEKVIKILCKRDGYTKAEATVIVKDVLAEVLMCIDNGNYFEAEDIFESELGLEVDYMLECLF